MKPFKEVINGIRKAIMASEVREDLAQMGEYVEQFANTAGENIQKAIDPTLSLSGKAADAAKVGEAVNAEATRAKAAEEENAKGVSQLKEDLVNIKDVTVVVKESKNLFNRNDEDYKPNTIYDTRGAETYNANTSTTGFIPCNVGDSFVVGYVNNLSAQNLTRQNVTFVYLYDSDRKFISRSTQFPFTNYVYTVSDTSAKFIRFSVSNALTEKDYVMIAKSSGNLPYEPYYAPYYVNKKDDDIARLDAKIDSASGRTVNTHVIDCWGDSRTEMQGDTSYAFYLQTLLGDSFNVCNYGISSQSSGMVCARLGSNEVFVSIENNAIPSTGEVKLTSIKCTSGNNRNLYAYSETAYVPCRINGISGRLSRTSISTYDRVKFKRDFSGDSVSVKPNTKIVVDDCMSRNHVCVLWFGKNDFASAESYAVSGICNNYDKAVEYLCHDKFIILGETCSLASSYEPNGADRVKLEQINTYLSEKYPNNFIDINAYLASEQALADVGLTATDTDREYIEKGFPCYQLMTFSESESDTVHPNAKGREAVANKIHAFMVEKGWV